MRQTCTLEMTVLYLMNRINCLLQSHLHAYHHHHHHHFPINKSSCTSEILSSKNQQYCSFIYKRLQHCDDCFSCLLCTFRRTDDVQGGAGGRKISGANVENNCTSLLELLARCHTVTSRQRTSADLSLSSF
ncbi:hypothetical protein Tsp_11720 [Trichinella spiralis]|uniref:hypothetical protein n=1 Tax=Trichinella spiralis TaxID=6334 RepID=UPI0001EFE6E0|nr:hypothetical protein Tsp_11720 [Trichinella spiralis]